LIIAFPDVIKRDFNGSEDFFIMGCDGIWEVKSNEEAVKFV